MEKKIRDRHLDTPSEANRDKHINFLALERNEKDPADVPAKGKLARQDQDQADKKGRQSVKKKK